MAKKSVLVPTLLNRRLKVKVGDKVRIVLVAKMRGRVYAYVEYDGSAVEILQIESGKPFHVLVKTPDGEKVGFNWRSAYLPTSKWWWARYFQRPDLLKQTR